MSGRPDPATAAIGDARVLLAALLASDWRELHVVSANCEIFIAQAGASENPMRAAAPAAPPHPERQQISVTAPHIATLVSVAAEGSRVAKDERVATLSVLDEDIAVAAPLDGVVGRSVVATGALVEFEQPILCLYAAG